MKTKTADQPRHYSNLKDSELTLSKTIDGPDIVPVDYFFKPDQNVVFLKHPRFIKFTGHKHSFIKMNYVYSGTCAQYINGKEVILTEGDLCILDRYSEFYGTELSDDDIRENSRK
jgi:AraC family transcriptional regulator, melibiose operon regulatory protein